MRHYRIVKKSAYFAIAISTLAVVFNSILFGAISAGLISRNNLTTTKAADAVCSGTGVSVDLVSVSTDIQVNESFGVHVAVADQTKTYSVQLYATDVETGKTYLKDSQFTIDPSAGGGVEARISLTSTGDKKIFARYSLLDASNIWCEDWPATNEISLKIGDNTTDSANIVIIVITVPEKTDKGEFVNIGWTVTGATGKKFVLSVSKGGNCPNEPDNPSCWYNSVHAQDPIDADPFTGTYGWSTAEQDTGQHAVNIKLYDTQNGNSTDKKLALFTICVPGTKNTTCVANNSVVDPNASDQNTDGPITVPDTIPAFSRFTSAFKMPNQITGPGELITVIIKVLEILLGAFAFIGIVVSGIQYISSGGDTAKAEKAKKNLLYCVIGIVVAVLALTLQNIIVSFWAGPS